MPLGCHVIVNRSSEVIELDRPPAQAGEANPRAVAFVRLADEHLDKAYRLARAILRDPGEAQDATHVDPDGALAGGICAVSTSLFDAAAHAGLPITARTSHGGYLRKYPLGLDAAVAKGEHRQQTLAFRNDTSDSIVIRTLSTPGVARVDLYGRTALGRTVEFSAPAISHRHPAHDRHIKTASLRRGEHRRSQDRSDGMTVVVTRTVRAADGHVIHHDRWTSVYRWLDGVILDGTA